MTVLSTLFWGVLLLCVVVVIHEGGHFLVARLFGVRVTEFAIGLPGPHLSFKRKTGKTAFVLTCIPLGGYARITGMEGGVEDPNLGPVLAYVYEHGNATPTEIALSLEEIDEDDAECALIILHGWGSIEKPTRKEKRAGDLRYKAPAVYDRATKSWRYKEGEARTVASAEELLNAERSQTYRSIGLIKRLCILFAGPFFNLLTAMILFVVILMTTPSYVVSNTIAGFPDESPAKEAGLVEGDEIIAINDETIEDGSDLSLALEDVTPGDDVQVTYRRGTEQATVTLSTINWDEQTAIGIYIGYEEQILSFGEAVVASTEYPIIVAEAVIDLLNPTQMQEVVENSTSVVGISVEAQKAASSGLASFLWLLAAISLSLCFMNLLPIPPLDGGRILIELIEKIIRRPLSTRVVNAISIVGIGLFMLLFVVLTVQDVGRYIL